MRFVFVFVIFLTLLVEYASAKWKIGIFNIESFDVVGSGVANAIKKSSLLILSRDFDMTDINTNLIDRNEVLNEGTKSKVDFSIYGFVSKKSKNQYRLVLHLLDVANKSVKVSREYEFEYDVDRIFEVIDSVVEDFREGANKVLPKYEESLAVEYRKIIEERFEEVTVPGRFLISFNILSYFFDLGFTIYPSIAFRYINNSKGGLLGNGWFAGFSIPSLLISFNTNKTRVGNTSKEISVYLGTKIIGPIGLGIDFLVIRFLQDGILPLQPRFCIYLNILDFDIVTYFTFPRRNGDNISDYTGLSLSIMYQFSKELGAEIQTSFDDYYVRSYQDVNEPRTRRGFSIGLGIFRSFEF
ncbi:MAG: hypothetical protein RMJ37_02455 [Spirochaetia bacterium]|nr:hypothetical protein [Spirochaetota bacterium]MCX8097067.1 hypothetical protein [Spirochaetota bacterium]MDW8112188.1 hypothetical protein [Spirochaetia bacterium]